jgi:hypothetical protein
MRQAYRRVVLVLAFLAASGVAVNTVIPSAEAAYGLNDALGTIGIAAGIGAVIGLSTIAFYDTPTAHLSNGLVGAGAGMIVGLGVAGYLMATSQDDEISPEELLPPENKPNGSGKTPGKDPAKSEKERRSFFRRGTQVPSRLLASVPATSAMRGRHERDARGWAVAVRVLELRF